MRNKKTVRILLTLIQISLLVALNFLLPLSDGTLFFVGIAFVVIAYFLKTRYCGWAIVLAYPITYVLANYLDTPAQSLGILPNNLYPFWYLFFAGASIVVIVIEVLIKLKKHRSN